MRAALVDLAPLDGSDPETNYDLIESELGRYNADLAALPRVLALSKADLVPSDDAAAVADQWRARLGDDKSDPGLTGLEPAIG